MLFCRTCELALPDGTRRCPVCGRSLRFGMLLLGGGIVLVVTLLGLLLLGSGRLKNHVDRNDISVEDVRSVAQRLVSSSPDVRNPVGFSSSEQTTVEHWDGRRWRVSGYVDTRQQSGAKVRTLYFAVVQYNGRDWNLEDLQLQSMELQPGPAARQK